MRQKSLSNIFITTPFIITIAININHHHHDNYNQVKRYDPKRVAPRRADCPFHPSGTHAKIFLTQIFLPKYSSTWYTCQHILHYNQVIFLTRIFLPTYSSTSYTWQNILNIHSHIPMQLLSIRRKIFGILFKVNQSTWS